MMAPVITHLVLAGAGMSGICYLGVLRYLETEGHAKNVRYISGTSMGAFFACAFALGVTAADLEEMSKSSFPSHVASTGVLALLRRSTRLGMDSGERLAGPLRGLLGDTTFIQLAKNTGKHLVICACCVEDKCVKYFSVDDTPNVKVADALQASMSIPLLFEPVKIDGKSYVDGGMCDNIPHAAFSHLPPASTLIVRIINSGSGAGADTGAAEKTAAPLSIYSYIMALLEIMWKNYSNTQHNFGDLKVLTLTESPIAFLKATFSRSGVTFEATAHEIDTALVYGYAQAHAFFKETFSRPPEDPPPYADPRTPSSR